jgi:hypothetical protein
MASSPFLRRSTGLLSSARPRGGGVERGARLLLYHRLGLAPFSLSPVKAVVPASSPSVWVGGREVE